MDEIGDDILTQVIELACRHHRLWTIRTFPYVNRRFRRVFFDSDAASELKCFVIVSELDAQALQRRIRDSANRLRTLEYLARYRALTLDLSVAPNLRYIYARGGTLTTLPSNVQTLRFSNGWIQADFPASLEYVSLCSLRENRLNFSQVGKALENVKIFDIEDDRLVLSDFDAGVAALKHAEFLRMHIKAGSFKNEHNVTLNLTEHTKLKAFHGNIPGVHRVIFPKSLETLEISGTECFAMSTHPTAFLNRPRLKHLALVDMFVDDVANNPGFFEVWETVSVGMLKIDYTTIDMSLSPKIAGGEAPLTLIVYSNLLSARAAAVQFTPFSERATEIIIFTMTPEFLRETDNEKFAALVKNQCPKARVSIHISHDIQYTARHTFWKRVYPECPLEWPVRKPVTAL